MRKQVMTSKNDVIHSYDEYIDWLNTQISEAKKTGFKGISDVAEPELKSMKEQRDNYIDNFPSDEDIAGKKNEIELECTNRAREDQDQNEGAQKIRLMRLKKLDQETENSRLSIIKENKQRMSSNIALIQELTKIYERPKSNASIHEQLGELAKQPEKTESAPQVREQQRELDEINAPTPRTAAGDARTTFADDPRKKRIIDRVERLIANIRDKTNDRATWFNLNTESKTAKLKAIATWLKTNTLTTQQETTILALIHDVCAIKRNALGFHSPHSLNEFKQMLSQAELTRIKDLHFTAKDLKDLGSNSHTIDNLLGRVEQQVPFYEM